MAYKVSVVSLGCPKNQVDAEMMLKYLSDGGFELSSVEAEADAIIINTCGFIEEAKAEAIENILECAAYKKEGKLKALIVTGCLAERYRDDITEEIPEVDLVVGIGSNSKIAQLTLKAIEGKAENSYGPKEDLDLNGERILGGMPFTAYIKISDGCDNCCTYCAIPEIRGRMRSRTIEDCVKEAEKLVLENLENGNAYKKFEEFITYQGGNLEELKVSNRIFSIKSPKTGFVSKIDTLKLGELVRSIGAGRYKKDDEIDYTVGALLNKNVGDYVLEGEELVKIYLNKKDMSLRDITNCFSIEESLGKQIPLILEVIE